MNKIINKPFTGRKKTSISRVWFNYKIKNHQLIKNDKLDRFFTTTKLNVTDFYYTFKGGGISSSIDAVISGILKAAIFNNLITKKSAEDLGYLVYDFRKVEEKKAGRVKARKSPPYKRR